jgi:hypothetical protein
MVTLVWLLPWLGQVALMVSGLVLLWLGIGLLVTRVLRLFVSVSLGFGSTIVIGFLCVCYLTAVFGITFRAATNLNFVVFGAAFLGYVWALLDRKTRIGNPISQVRRFFLVRWDYLLVIAMILVAFMPLVLRGATYWTLGSNDFPWFLGHLDVWREGGIEEYKASHPGPYGDHMVAGAYSEKPVSSAVLQAVTLLAGGSYAAVQTPFFFLIVAFTAVLLVKIVRTMTLAHPVARTLLVGGALLGLYPWARVLHGQVGHVLCVLFLVTALMWVQAIRNAREPRQSLAYSSLVGLSLALAFGANAEVATLSFLSVVSVGGIIFLWRGMSRRHGLVSLTVIGLTALICTIPFVPGALDVARVAYLRIPTETLLDMRPSLPLPSPFAFLALQISYESFTTPQNLVLWAITLLGVAIGISLLPRRSRVVVGSSVLLILVNALAIVALFGVDNYVSGKYFSALIVIVAAPLIYLVLRIPARGYANALAIASGFIAVITSTFYASKIPFVVPRDLGALVENETLRGLDAVNIRLGNYYEDAMAALVIPTERMYLNDSTYADGTVNSNFSTLVRLDAVVQEEVIPLNETYGLAPARHAGARGQE